MRPITFGTDGWRGVIADDFTYDRVAAVCAAIGAYLREDDTATRGVAIGYDNRFASEDFAALAATVLTRQGIPVQLSQHSLPTPVISYTTNAQHLGGGVMITASHNPAKYNGIKFKPWFGGSASPDETRDIQGRANQLLDALDVDALRRQGPDPQLLTRVDFVPPYLQRVLALVNVGAINAACPRLLFDPLYGSSIGVLDRALVETGCEVTMIHGERNPAFGGLHPEPIGENLAPLRAAVRDVSVDGALASDGDGDRLSAMTGSGVYVSPHHVFALLLMHLVEDLGKRGEVVKTVSTTTMIDQLAARYDLPLHVTPVGFKYISQLMRERDVLIGGEESGGIGVRGHIPERDATLAALLLVEMMAMRHATLDDLLAQLRERVGDHAYDRRDLRLERPVTREEMVALAAHLPPQIGGVRVDHISQLDGVKLSLADGSWLLLRASGTEPVMRVYAEAATPAQVQTLLDTGRALVDRQGLERAA